MRRVAETGHARGLRSRAEIGSETVKRHLEIGRIDTEAKKKRAKMEPTSRSSDAVFALVSKSEPTDTTFTDKMSVYMADCGCLFCRDCYQDQCKCIFVST